MGGGYEIDDGGYVTCGGEITVVFEWIPRLLPNGNNDPFDIPPASVILKEEASATANAVSLSSSHVAVSDNGLGHIPVVYQDAISSYSHSSGVRLKIIQGDYEVLVKCSPTASAMGDGLVDSTVSYKATLITPRIFVHGLSFFTAENKFRVLTGQQIATGVEFIGLDGVTAGAEFDIDPNSWQWSLPDGQPFKDYIIGSTTGTLVALGSSDVNSAVLTYYTSEAAIIEPLVEFTILPKSGEVLSGSGTVDVAGSAFESVRPELVSATSSLGSVAITFLAGTVALGFVGPGIEVSSILLEVEHFGETGTACAVQLITPRRYATAFALDNSVLNFEMANNGQEGLDLSFPYPYSGAWALPTPGNFEDSPWVGLASLSRQRSGRADDSFRTWIMYLPPSVDSRPTCWVPLSKFTWSWYGEALRLTLRAPFSLSGDERFDQSPITRATDHPQWVRIVDSTSFAWVQN